MTKLINSYLQQINVQRADTLYEKVKSPGVTSNDTQSSNTSESKVSPILGNSNGKGENCVVQVELSVENETKENSNETDFHWEPLRDGRNLQSERSIKANTNRVAKPPIKTKKQENIQTRPATVQSKFVAVRRKNINSYYLGNIDPETTDTDIYDYISERKVKCTNIVMFYGRYGSAAKINVPADFEKEVESESFWPVDITFRKWQTKTLWQKENGNSGYNYRRQNHRQMNTNVKRRYKRYNNYEQDNDYDNDTNDTYHSNSWNTSNHDDWNIDIEHWADSRAEAY